jgi:hypothetical protein
MPPFRQRSQAPGHRPGRTRRHRRASHHLHRYTRRPRPVKRPARLRRLGRQRRSRRDPSVGLGAQRRRLLLLHPRSSAIASTAPTNWSPSNVSASSSSDQGCLPGSERGKTIASHEMRNRDWSRYGSGERRPTLLLWQPAGACLHRRPDAAPLTCPFLPPISEREQRKTAQSTLLQSWGASALHPAAPYRATRPPSQPARRPSPPPLLLRTP